MLHRLILVSTALLVPAWASAQPPARPDETVPVVITTGEAIVKRAPDRAWLTITAESRARTPREAQKQNADAMAAVMEKLKGAGLPADAIRTTGYELQPEYDFHEGRRTLRGYFARNAVEVRLDQIERAGEILELAVGAGATTVGGIRFDLKERTAAEREALSAAVADARARANAAAAGAGMSVDRVLRISEQPPPSDPRPVMMTMAVQREAVEQPPITPGELEIRAVVTLTAAIK